MIDDAIVVVENISLHRAAGQRPLQAVRSALSEITVPLIGSTITPIVVLVPLPVVTGVTGLFFRALAITVAAALLTSLLLALTWTPTLSEYFIRSNRARVESDSANAGETGEQEVDDGEEEPTGRFQRALAFYNAGCALRSTARGGSRSLAAC